MPITRESIFDRLSTITNDDHTMKTVFFGSGNLYVFVDDLERFMRGVKRSHRDANDLVVEIYATSGRYFAMLFLKGIDRWTPGDVLLEGDPGVNLRQAWRGLMLALNRAVKGFPR